MALASLLQQRIVQEQLAIRVHSRAIKEGSAFMQLQVQASPVQDDMSRPADRSVASMFADAIRALELALEARDNYTGGHSARVSRYTEAIARAMGLSRADVKELVLAAELHDLGKIGVPDEVLRKAGPLTADEFRRVKSHPAIGEQILRSLLADHPTVLSVVRWHHERLDGSGYPDGLSGSQIPLAARIVAVADTFDAMTSARPYREPLPMEEVLAELRRCSGTSLDPACVAALLSAIRNNPELIGQPVPACGVRRPTMIPGVRLGSTQAIHLMFVRLFHPDTQCRHGPLFSSSLSPPARTAPKAGGLWDPTGTKRPPPGPNRASLHDNGHDLTRYSDWRWMLQTLRH